MNDQAVGGGHGHPTGTTGGRQPGLEAQVERLKEQNRYLLVTNFKLQKGGEIPKMLHLDTPFEFLGDLKETWGPAISIRVVTLTR